MHYASKRLINPPNRLLYTAGKRSMSTEACDSAAVAHTAGRLMLLTAFYSKATVG
jgi:hypothetical protein